MKKLQKIIVALGIIISLCAGCGGNTTTNQESSEQAEITLAYQSGVSYAPLIVMKEFGLIEKHYNGDINVNWVEMTSGSAINEGLIAGSIDVGAMGVPVAITGVQAGSPYKLAFGLAAQPFGILTNSDRINSLSDITAEDQIALPNINSIQHILLAMAAKAELGDAHALDGNLTALSNPDGYTAIISGAVACHVALSPYNFMERVSGDAPIHEISVGEDVWPVGDTIIAAVVGENLKSGRPGVYDALMSAVEEAMEYIAEDPENTASILAKGYDASPEEILQWITDERSIYSMELHGVMDMANFMVEEGFLAEGPNSFGDLVYENVKGD